MARVFITLAFEPLVNYLLTWNTALMKSWFPFYVLNFSLGTISMNIIVEDEQLGGLPADSLGQFKHGPADS